MERFNLKDLAETLGIYSPWIITAANIDAAAKVLNVHLGQKEKKIGYNLFGKMKKEPNNEIISGSWSYMLIGMFRCVIHADIPDQGFDGNVLSAPLFKHHDFIGHPGRNYSNYIRQKVAQAKAKGFSVELISNTYGIEREQLNIILADLEQLPYQLQTLVLLPCESDPIWERVLLAHIQLNTKVLPLKLLLSKLRSSALKTKDNQELRLVCKELRSFFVANIHSLKDEVNQLCCIEQNAHDNPKEKPKIKIVLPGARNALWLEVINGSINLKSSSVPLNLLISKQRSALKLAKSNREKIHVIEPVYQYVSKNYRTLKHELIIINKELKNVQKTNIKLPSPDHYVWKNILQNDSVMPSENLAYKLLLSKLRMKIENKNDPLDTREAAEKVQGFIRKNHSSMRKELQVLLNQVEG